MQSKALLAMTWLFLSACNAAPQATPSGPLAPSAKFSLMALRSASEVHFASFGAAKSSLFLHLPAQNASCDAGEADYATFYLQDGGLYLYAASATPQQLFADRSGMGQGKLGYTTGAQPAPRNGERTCFELDEYNDLTLNGAGFLACPNSIDGAWSVWVATDVAQPAGNEGCLGISVRAVEISEPNGCAYTE
ncbi:cell wall protein PhiA [Hypomontagnella monticulosa]|nr:cell wall protein PhiA [Hypomontagnella monticulosa]